MVKETTISQRNTKLDSVKAVLILLVVLGHTLQSRDPGILNTINVTVKTFIFSFHMPLFVLISGYFCNTKYDKETLFKKVLEILATYIVFQIIRSVLIGKYGLYAVLSPRYTLWYLLCLIYWRVIVYFLSRYLSLNAILIFSIIVSLCSGYIRSDVLSVQRACSFFPFFILGYYFHNYPSHDILKKIDNSHIIYSLVVLVVCSIICIMMKMEIGINLLRVFVGKYPYTGHTDSLIRGAWLIVSTSLSIAIYRLIPDKEVLAKYGGCTLVIYLLHSFFTPRFTWLIKHHIVWNDLITNIVFAIIVFIICAWLSRYKIIKILTKPLSFKYKKD